MFSFYFGVMCSCLIKHSSMDEKRQHKCISDILYDAIEEA